jgi:ribonucleoside-diphosphate reductase alpha chain
MLEHPFSKSIMELRYSWDTNHGKESWSDIAHRVSTNVMSVVPVNNDIISNITHIIETRKFIPGGRFLAQAGRPFHQTNNCFTLRAEDTREGWGDLLNKATLMLMSGGGIGIDYSDLRPNGSILKRSGGTSSGPIPLMKVVNEVGRGVMSGGKRRSAIWSGLRWSHDDIQEFITLKNWIPEVRKLKEKDYDFPAAMDMTNISVILDKDFFEAYDNVQNPKHELAHTIYWTVIDRMLKTGEPGFSVDFANSKESLRNACTEIVSEDDSDVCCLGSVNLSQIETIEELREVTELAQLFLIAGTQYSDAPTQKVKEIRNKNLRTGLGAMGIHEWLITRGYNYDKNDELASWLQTWKDTSDDSAKEWSGKFSLNEPVAKRAVAPNGSIAIAGGMTTGGLEPIFATAYQRRYLTPDGWKKQYVVDFIIEKLMEKGFDPEEIEDSYVLSLDVERRIRFQSFIQKYTDNAISSTINLPSFGEEGNNDVEFFGNTLYKYLPTLRGVTVYPNGARGGQPLVPVDVKFAMSKRGVVFEGNEDCAGGICGL